VGDAIPFEDKKAIEDVACYLVRVPLSLKKLVYLDGQKAVLYRSKMDPFLGRNFEAVDPLEYYAYYANRVRGQRSPEDKPSPTGELVRVPVDDERREIEAY
jgi:hypothetical protein